MTGWDASVAESLSAAERSSLEAILSARLEAAGMTPTLCGDLTVRTFVVFSPWNGAAETQRDLALAYKVHPAVAWLAYAVLTERLARLAAEQRSSSANTAASFTATDLEALVEHVATSVDLDSLAEAVVAGVCAAVDFLAPSELIQADFLRGVSAAPAHIAAGLDVERPAELKAILDGLDDRRHVLVAGPSGSGKSTLMWRSAQLLTLRARIVRVYRVQSEADIVLLIRHVLRSQPSGAAPVVICADDVAAPAMSLWSTGLAEFLRSRMCTCCRRCVARTICRLKLLVAS